MVLVVLIPMVIPALVAKKLLLSKRLFTEVKRVSAVAPLREAVTLISLLNTVFSAMEVKENPVAGALPVTLISFSPMVLLLELLRRIPFKPDPAEVWVMLLKRMLRLSPPVLVIPELDVLVEVFKLLLMREVKSPLARTASLKVEDPTV